MGDSTWIFVVIWVLCALWGGNIYKGKGRSYWAGFLIGLLLGLIGVALCALSTKVDEETARCPYCQEKIIPGAKICKHCRSSLIQPPPTAP